MPAAPIMSINSDVSPLPASSSAREEQAKVAGHVIYNSVHGAADNTRIPPPVSAPVLPSFSDPDMGGPSGPAPLTASLAADPMSEGRMSSVRRTFCLFVLFDLILMFILWVIYAQLIGDTGYKAFEKEVQNYTFASSLFDSVMLSAVRFTFLLLAYALYRSGHWWMVAFTTALTCGVLIAKIFLFDFEGSKSNNNPLSYCIIIISFVLAWVETWFLDFKVLPHEKKLMSRLAASTGRGYGSTYTSQGYRTFSNDDMQSVITEDNQFYSPLDSPEGSDTESDVKESRGAVGGAVAARGLSRQENDYIRLARHSWEVLWTYITSPESDWKSESGSSIEAGVVHSKKVKGVGKVFRLTTLIEWSPKATYEAVNFQPETQPQWNSALKESQVLQMVDDNTDILYNIAAEVAGGVITSRDFVSLRTWGQREGMYISAGMGVNHPDKPPQKAYVRGKNGVGGWVYKPVEGEPNKCLFLWFMNTDIGGWFPQRLIDVNMAKVLMDFNRDLQAHVRELKSSRSEP